MEDVERGLGNALAQATEKHQQLLPRQVDAFEYTFHTGAGSTAAERGANAIADFVRGLQQSQARQEAV